MLCYMRNRTWDGFGIINSLNVLILKNASQPIFFNQRKLPLTLPISAAGVGGKASSLSS